MHGAAALALSQQPMLWPTTEKPFACDGNDTAAPHLPGLHIGLELVQDGVVCLQQRGNGAADAADAAAPMVV